MVEMSSQSPFLLVVVRVVTLLPILQMPLTCLMFAAPSALPNPP